VEAAAIAAAAAALRREALSGGGGGGGGGNGGLGPRVSFRELVSPAPGAREDGEGDVASELARASLRSSGEPSRRAPPSRAPSLAPSSGGGGVADAWEAGDAGALLGEPPGALSPQPQPQPQPHAQAQGGEAKLDMGALLARLKAASQRVDKELARAQPRAPAVAVASPSPSASSLAWAARATPRNTPLSAASPLGLPDDAAVAAATYLDKSPPLLVGGHRARALLSAARRARAPDGDSDARPPRAPSPDELEGRGAMATGVRAAAPSPASTSGGAAGVASRPASRVFFGGLPHVSEESADTSLEVHAQLQQQPPQQPQPQRAVSASLQLPGELLGGASPLSPPAPARRSSDPAARPRE
jgi:hypothetical protein